MAEVRFRILLVPDWLAWITGTQAKAIKAHHPQLDCDIIPAAALRHALNGGWKPENEFDVVHLMTTQVAEEFGPRFLGRIPTVTSMHHIHDVKDLEADTSGDAIMTVSSPWEDELARRGVPREKMIRVANGADTEFFRPPSEVERNKIRRKFRLENEELVIGFVGKKGSDNFGRKGFDIFCDGLIQLRNSGTRCVALVQGSGWQGELQERLKGQVRFTHVPFARDPSEVYRAMDFYWVASRIEGGPVPLLEAMASGVPCVCNRVGMVGDVVENGVSGLITREPSPKEFAELTGGLRADAAGMWRMAEAARERIVRKFDWRVSVQSAARLYETARRRFWLARGRATSAFDHTEQTEVVGHMPLERVPVMICLPTDIRAACLYAEEIQMVEELFRVRNRWPATCLAISVWIHHPAQTLPLIRVVMTGWLHDVRITLGRWKRKIRSALQRSN